MRFGAAGWDQSLLISGVHLRPFQPAVVGNTGSGGGWTRCDFQLT